MPKALVVYKQNTYISEKPCCHCVGIFYISMESIMGSNASVIQKREKIRHHSES